MISNNSTVFLYLTTAILFIILISVLFLSNQNISFSVEYTILIILILVSGYLLIGSTNLFSSIFFLEFIALMIFGKFTVSKILYKNNKAINTTNVYLNQYSYGLFNALFFQF